MSDKKLNKIIVSPLDLQIAPLPKTIMEIMACDPQVLNCVVTYGRDGQPNLAYCVLTENGKMELIPSSSYVPKCILEYSVKTSSSSSSSSSSQQVRKSSNKVEKKEKKKKEGNKKKKNSSSVSNIVLSIEEWKKLSSQQSCEKFFSQFERKQYKNPTGAVLAALKVRVGERFSNRGDMLTKIKESLTFKSKQEFLEIFQKLKTEDLAQLFVSNKFFLGLSKPRLVEEKK